jgi:hypothetical protein
MKPEMSRKKQMAGVLYGLAAGLAFAIFAWGIDALLLARAHGAFAWVKFIPSIFICAASGALVGWLSMLVQRVWFTFLIWLAQALFFAHLILWLPLKLAPPLIKIFNPALGDFLKYPYYPELQQNLWFGFVFIAAVSIVCALLEGILIDQALFSSGKFALIVPLVVASMAFALIGKTTDSLLNKNLRDPILSVDRVIEFALENEGKEVPSEVARKMRLFALNQVSEAVTSQRTLILSNFDEMMGQVDVLVDFDGQWVKCPVIWNQVSVCSTVNVTPWIRLSGIYKLGLVNP